MGNRNVQESQQQSQGITIGTQGNDNQPTPHGDDLNYRSETGDDGKTIPNQENSSAANQQRSQDGSDR